MPDGRLPHHRPHAYELAQQLAEGVRRLPPDAQPGSADLRAQLQRASHSVVRNIAEGANRWTAADKIARFAIAQGERLELVPTSEITALRRLIPHIGRLLGGRIRRQRVRQRQERAREGGSGSGSVWARLGCAYNTYRPRS